MKNYKYKIYTILLLLFASSQSSFAASASELTIKEILIYESGNLQISFNQSVNSKCGGSGGQMFVLANQYFQALSEESVKRMLSLLMMAYSLNSKVSILYEPNSPSWSCQIQRISVYR